MKNLKLETWNLKQKARLFAAWLLVLGLAGAAQAEPDLPLPKGAVAISSEPHEVKLGTRSLEVESFLVEMTQEELVAFYERELPRADWRLGKLAWQAHQDRATARLERALNSTHRDHPQADEMRAKLAAMRRTQQAMRRQLYASRGQEHVIVNLMPMGERMAIFFNHWIGDSTWVEGNRTWGSPTFEGAPVQADPSKAVYQSTLRPAALAHSAQPSLNVCCSGEEVPGLEEALPFGVPRYPQARAMSQSSPKHGERTVVLLTAPNDPEQVASYYRREMPKQGWVALSEQRQFTGPARELHQLRYQQADHVCEITLQGATESGDGAQTIITITVAPST